MTPTALVPGQPVQAAPNTSTAQGVAQPTPVGAPTPTQLPTAPQVAATPAPVQAPNLDTAGQLQNIANYYQIPRQTAQIVNSGQSQGNVAGQQFAASKAQRDIQIQNQQDSLDPSKYTITKDPATGGVNITNSLGDQVPLSTYVNLTGANPATVLQNSTNPADVKFVAAYNNLQTYSQDMIAAQNGDAQAQAEVQQYQAANPGLANMELGQLSQAFMSQYGSYFGAPQQGAGGGNIASGVTPTLSSQNNPAALSAFENPTYTGLLPNGSQYTPSPVAGGNSNANSIGSLLTSLQAQNTGG